MPGLFESVLVSNSVVTLEQTEFEAWFCPRQIANFKIGPASIYPESENGGGAVQNARFRQSDEAVRLSNLSARRDKPEANRPSVEKAAKVARLRISKNLWHSICASWGKARRYDGNCNEYIRIARCR